MFASPSPSAGLRLLMMTGVLVAGAVLSMFTIGWEETAFWVRLPTALGALLVAVAAAQSRFRLAQDGLILTGASLLVPLVHGGFLPGSNGAAVLGLTSLLIPMNWAAGRLVLARAQSGTLVMSVLALVWGLQVSLVILIGQGEFPELATALAPLNDARLWISPPEALVALPQAGGIAFVLAILLSFVWPGPEQGGPTASGSLLLTGLMAVCAIATDPVGATAFLVVTTVALLVVSVSGFFQARRLDPESGLSRRSQLYALLERQVAPYTLTMVAVHDAADMAQRYGPGSLQQMLKLAAASLERKTGGMSFRFKEGEVALVLPGRRANSAKETLAELQQAMAEYEFRLRSWRRPPNLTPEMARQKRGAAGKGGGPVRVQLSMGVAEGMPGRDRHSTVAERASRTLLKALEGPVPAIEYWRD